MVEETYKLTKEGKVEYTYKTDSVDLKAIDNKTNIGHYYNMSVNYIDNKETCINDLEEKKKKYSEELESLVNQFENIYIDMDLFSNLKSFDEKCAEVLKAVKEVKDYGNEDFIVNNPKKYAKALKETRVLKENMIAHLTELDKAIKMYNRKEELSKQIELYKKEVEKMTRQIQEVEKL